MNLKDIYEFESEEKISYENILKQIFERQKELLIKYREIEKLPITVDINNPAHQKLLKEFTFRGVEELAEAYEAHKENNTEHFLEEISDAIHFFTEVLLMVGLDENHLDINLEEFDSTESTELNLDNLEIRFWHISYQFGISCNRLKSKPWKQDQVVADVDEYKKQLLYSYKIFLRNLMHMGFGSRQILEIYIMKNKVNQFRLRSKY